MSITRRRFAALAALSPFAAGRLLAEAASRGLAGGESGCAPQRVKL